MRVKISHLFFLFPLLAIAARGLGCGGGDSEPSAAGGGGGSAAGSTGSAGSSGSLTGQGCTTATGCYAGLDGGTLSSAPICLDKITGGYCTHLCKADADCCSVAGECAPGVKEVCAPFESTGMMMCFVSCDSADVSPPAGWDGGTITPDQYCAAVANAGFGCRSTGGGKDNRKFCSK